MKLQNDQKPSLEDLFSSKKMDRPSEEFWENFQDDPRFYFVHSYKYSYQDSSYIAGESTYEKENFASIIKLENITGFQFHPEKSHNYGMRLLHQFLLNCDY